jgi:CrcB protein
MELLIRCFAVGVAGGCGSVLRFLVSTLCGRLFGTAFPVGTLVINVSGSLLLGWFLTVMNERLLWPDTARLAIAVGLVGGYTTFSAFMVESSGLMQEGSNLKAFANLVGSIVLGLAAVRVGIWLASVK